MRKVVEEIPVRVRVPAEEGTEIIIERGQHMMVLSRFTQQLSLNQLGVPVNPGASDRAAQEDRGVAITAPLTGVFYSAPSPASPPFMNLGDVVHVGQVVALI